MDSGLNDLNSSESIRWNGAIKVYTRRAKRKAAILTADDDGTTKAETTATEGAPQTHSEIDTQKECVDVHEPSRPSVHCVGTELTKPVISRVEDRVRIHFSGARPLDEFRDLIKKVETELNQVRDLVKKLETTELQLSLPDNGVDVRNRDTFCAVAADSGALGRPQFPPNSAVKNRALVRVNSEASSVRHQDFRHFRPPSISVIENNIGVGELVEKERRTPRANQFYTNAEFVLGNGRFPSESNKKFKPNGARKKSGGEPDDGFSLSVGPYNIKKNNSNVFRNCSSLLQTLMSHTYGWVFNNPVDAEALGLRDYHDIIKHPMDFGTVKTRLSQNFYKSPLEFAHDVRLVFRNAMTYNPKGQDVHIMADQMSKIFEEKWVAIEADYNPSWSLQFCHDSDAKMKPSFSCRTPVLEKPKANDLNKRDMTFEEKQKLGTDLQTLPPERLDEIVQIVKRNSSLGQQSDEIELDIDSVDAETLWELDRLVTSCKKNFGKNWKEVKTIQARPAQAALEMVRLPCPVVDHSPKKDRSGDKLVDNATRSSSSSSSSSDSGSSSSDSDSDSSSASKADAVHSPKS
ncbi:unnamed protein product [Cuscuta epithymum]|uniref:Uncharacterized protein n=1 Tax=Cuscuta epithymum TaxID=186058 RepID=A0AAV0DMD5_9ASTE|nr:unnamed protein product [Cuscuta epithymum]